MSDYLTDNVAASAAGKVHYLQEKASLRSLSSHSDRAMNGGGHNGATSSIPTKKKVTLMEQIPASAHTDSSLRSTKNNNTNQSNYTEDSEDVSKEKDNHNVDPTEFADDCSWSSSRDGEFETHPDEEEETGFEPSVATMGKRLTREDEKDTWGSVTRKEFILMTSIILVIIIASVAVVVVAAEEQHKTQHAASNQGGDPSKWDGDNLTRTPTATTDVKKNGMPSLERQYALLLERVASNPVTAQAYSHVLPVDISGLTGPDAQDPALQPVVRAAAWALLQDEQRQEHFNLDYDTDMMVTRFALAIIYFSNGGHQWKRNDGWLSSQRVCEWEAVQCDPVVTSGVLTVFELDLANNNLVGEIPAAVALLPGLRVLWLNDNALTGSIPGDVLGTMPELSILYVQKNQLQGEIPASLRDNGLLQTLFLHGNNFTGNWPETLCPACNGCEPPLKHFRLNCEQTPCPSHCCHESENCFA